MPKFLIERDAPGAGQMSAGDLQGASNQSNNILKEMGPQIQWLQSYVTGDKIFCIYISPNEEMIREHGEKLGLKAKRILQIDGMIDPTTGEE
jgi:hypothetical protein